MALTVEMICGHLLSSSLSTAGNKKTIAQWLSSLKSQGPRGPLHLIRWMVWTAPRLWMVPHLLCQVVYLLLAEPPLGLVVTPQHSHLPLMKRTFVPLGGDSILARTLHPSTASIIGPAAVGTGGSAAAQPFENAASLPLTKSVAITCPGIPLGTSLSTTCSKPAGITTLAALGFIKSVITLCLMILSHIECLPSTSDASDTSPSSECPCLQHPA